MTPLEDLRKRVEEAIEATVGAQEIVPHRCTMVPIEYVVCERQATDALIEAMGKRVSELERTHIDMTDELAAQANLMRKLEKALNCEECGGTGNEGYDFKFTLDGGEAVARPCPTCGPIRSEVKARKA